MPRHLNALPELSRLLLGFAVAALGGWLWTQTGLPLGWLMGAAIATGAFAVAEVTIPLPKTIHRAALVAIGTGVGLVLTPEVAARLLGWAPVMLASAGLGIALALVFAPLLARLGGMSRTTAYFALLPGGVIEMATIGGKLGADRMTIAALHTIRVGLVVGLLPLALFALFPHDMRSPTTAAQMNLPVLAAALAIGALGGWLGARVNLPAAWLLGAVIASGVVSATGVLPTRLPSQGSALAQIIVGMSLGLRFERHRLAAIPRALAAGAPILLAIMAVMAAFAALASLILPLTMPTLVLAFSIGGMAEMVLTAKALHQDIAIVAAFQAIRGITVNAIAGLVWTRLHPPLSLSEKGHD